MAWLESGRSGLWAWLRLLLSVRFFAFPTSLLYHPFPLATSRFGGVWPEPWFGLVLGGTIVGRFFLYFFYRSSLAQALFCAVEPGSGSL